MPDMLPTPLCRQVGEFLCRDGAGPHGLTRAQLMARGDEGLWADPAMVDWLFPASCGSVADPRLDLRGGDLAALRADPDVMQAIATILPPVLALFGLVIDDHGYVWSNHRERVLRWAATPGVHDQMLARMIACVDQFGFRGKTEPPPEGQHQAVTHPVKSYGSSLADARDVYLARCRPSQAIESEAAGR